MGMSPSASLSYGMDLGEWGYDEPEEDRESEDLPWLTWELWSDSWEIETASATYLERQGVEGVSIQCYGHPDYPRYALVTKAVGSYGWSDLTVVSTEDLAITDDATRLLRAWKLLFPDREPGELAWRLSATFG